MVEARDFAPVIVQATIITPDEGLVVARLANELAPQWRDRFDGVPMILPPVPGMVLPSDIPRAILQSADGAWKFEAASGRASVVCSGTDAGLPVAWDEFYRVSTALLLQYRDAFRMRVGRLGAVLTRFAQQNQPGIALARHFCAERWLAQPLNRPESFELHAHKRYALDGWGDVNSWMRVKTAQLSIAEGLRPVIMTEQDINTLVEEAPTRNYSERDIGVFFDLVRREFDNILRLYFPEAVR